MNDKQRDDKDKFTRRGRQVTGADDEVGGEIGK